MKNNNFPNISKILKTYLLVLSIFSIFRLILFFSDLERVSNILTKEPFSDILYAFFMGFRFDLVVSSYILILPYLILTVSSFFKINDKLHKILNNFLFYLILIPFSITFFISSADIPFFNQFYSRFNITAFAWNDNIDIVASMIVNEPKYFLVAIPFIVLLTIFMLKLKSIFFNYNNHQSLDKPKTNIFIKIIISLIFFLLIFIGIRGRTAAKSPIRVGTAYFCTNPFLNQLGLNANFTLLRSYLNSKKKRHQYVNLLEENEALKNTQSFFHINQNNSQKYPIARKISNNNSRSNKPNIILIMFESMTAYKMSRYGNQYNLTPFLDSITNHSIVFDNFYSSGIHTEGGVYTVNSSYPSIFEKHMMKGTEMKSFNGIAHTLKQNNYSTIFFMTHDSEFDNMGGFIKSNYYDKLISEEDYPNDAIRGVWGVPDDYLFTYSLDYLEKLNQKQKPFLATYMTVSDHGPYTIPDYFKPLSKEIEKQVVEYVDWSIRKFITDCSKKDWFDNTIFVLTADHGAPANSFYDLPENYFHIPLIIYSPNLIKPKVYNKMGLQQDIFPTIMNFINVEYTNNTMGINLINEEREFAYFSTLGKYGVRNQDYYYINRLEGKESLFKYSDKKSYKINLIDSLPKLAKKMKIYAESNLQTAQYLTKTNKHFIRQDNK